MNPLIGSALALAAFIAGGLLYGWKGVILALTIVVFWLLLQFSRLMRTMRAASDGPVGQVGSAVMLHAKLREGMKMLEVLPLTGSLGSKVAADAASASETWAWTDAGAVRVELRFEGGKLARWTLVRPDEAADAGTDASSAP